ncbi:MAG: 4Fe-4S binding protein [Sedimentisphaerales bacterium]|nr:4Fe-4S binding protein [Sedimentisphaerales bacterium]
MAVKVDLDKCNGCGSCVEACPADALSLDGDKVCINEDNCIDCGVCIDECPVNALNLD